MYVSHIAEIFKAYDVRGKVGTELTTEVAEKIGRALADWLPNGGAVAVGRDMRPDSEELANAVIRGLQLQGRDVVNIGQVTSDMIYFATGSLGLAGGAVVTASHNPGEYNGIKLCREQAKPIGQDTGLFDIRDAILGDKFATPAETPGTVTEQDVSEAWVEHVLSFIDTDELKPLKIAVDAGNGMAGKIFPELEPYVPWEVEEMYFELDGTFPNHEANPLKPENLEDLIKVIRDKKLDGGIAFDGDGDRAFLVDETGVPLSGSVLTTLLAEYFLREHPGSTILCNVICSKSAIDAVERGGGVAIRTKVGHSNIKADMEKHGAIFAGEHSGHFFFRDNWNADSGLIAAVIGLYVAGMSGKKLSELREQYTTYFSIPETNFEVADKEAIFAQLKKTFSASHLDELDGLTVDLGNGTWFNVRPSNTEPLLRLNAESDSQESLDEITHKVAAIIENA